MKPCLKCAIICILILTIVSFIDNINYFLDSYFVTYRVKVTDRTNGSVLSSGDVFQKYRGSKAKKISLRKQLALKPPSKSLQDEFQSLFNKDLKKTRIVNRTFSLKNANQSMGETENGHVLPLDRYAYFNTNLDTPDLDVADRGSSDVNIVVPEVPVRRLPQCLVLGFSKCGTYALLHFLSRHPDVVEVDREVMYFCDDAYAQHDIDW